MLLVLSVGAAAQIGKAPNTPVFTGTGEKTEKASNLRALHGQIMSPKDAPLEKAVVYLKDKRSLRIITFITTKTGEYHFNGLNANVDYEVRAEHEGAFSSTRTLSLLDGRKDVAMNLRIEDKKPGDSKDAAKDASPEL